jgi:hypothetical protein
MVNYSDGKIYKIVCDTTNLTYIGSTCESLCNRLGKHAYNYRNYGKNHNRYYTSYMVLENNNYKIVLLEKNSCNDKTELLARERFYIENNECVNKQVPLQNKTEYRQQHRDNFNKYSQLYHSKNRAKRNEQAKEYNKIYYNLNKEKVKEQKQIWREDNKVKLADKRKEYYKANKDEINRKRREAKALKKQQA